MTHRHPAAAPLAHRFVTTIGGDWTQATLRYGDSEFVG